ncbi:UNVERIFIED_CONTAM: putative mitochondrial protein [Sesamum latifolium]|uniref:Mitochondrial protein n=1 Tax=Sesamum latifolium TaxID=2727402 RepID=A0AAW2X7I1_9LAMI
MDSIISPCQAAFVLGRLITDNVLLAFEVNHFLRTKRWGEKGHMALKLDINKAYGKVEWKFLKRVLLRLGFPAKVTELIMLCVSSVSYSFILCGSQFGSVIPQRGLRQGDPLSPYLFLLCTEAFSALLQKEERCGRLQGVAVCRQAPRVSHLLFADDTLIFCQATTNAALAILEVLDTFGRAAGQEINLDKSSVVFSKNTASSLRDVIQGTLQIRVEARHDLYLGLPSVVGKSRRSVFQSIRDRIWNRICGWNERNLSQAGKEVLIKAVTQAIPTYAMGCFRLPSSSLRKFNPWWRIFGGIMLWRIISTPHSLLSRVLRARYFPDGNALSAPIGRNPSFTWRSIQAAQRVIRGGFRWRIGSRSSVRVWEDPWIPRPYSFRALSRLSDTDPNLMVSDLIDASSKAWNQTLIQELFWPEDVEAILSIPLSSIGGEDFFVWHHTTTGMFFVRSAYYVAVSLANQSQPSSTCPISPLWKDIWKANVPEHEDIAHVFVRCSFVRQVWALSHIPWGLVSEFSSDPCGWIENLAKELPTEDFERFMTICWSVWWNRNRSLMERVSMSAGELLSFATNYLHSFQQAATLPDRIDTKVINRRWSPLGIGEIKLNFDGAVFLNSSEIGLGVIAQDSDGVCIGWRSVRMKGLRAPEMVEATAAREAILLAERFGWRRITLEGDCANLYFKLVSCLPDCSALGIITRDIKSLASAFDSCSFSLVRRTGNQVAHRLARHATTLVSEGTCFPPLLSEHLSSEFD